MKKHINILDFLRAIAALCVVFYHFNIPFVNPNLLSNITFYGQYGVQIFFVISGFIIPYSMHWNNYTISDYFKNLMRRYVRIDPPSYIAFLLIIGLYYLAIILVNRPIRGMEWPGINFTSIFGNLTYTVPYLNTIWFNPVYWTLAIEFQFYILIGLLLPLIMRKNNLLTSVTLIAIMLIGYQNYIWFFRYASFFVMGLLIFTMREKLIDRRLIYLLFFISISFCYSQNGIAEFLFGLSTFLVILSGIDFQFKLTTFLGKISYSLYITHLFVLYVLKIVSKRIIDISKFENSKLIIFFLFVGIAIASAYIFYKIIEEPFIKLSKRIKYARAENILEPVAIN
jgi:peptidoglycan/LPS O-acetylase OafA/YrhL